MTLGSYCESEWRPRKHLWWNSYFKKVAALNPATLLRMEFLCESFSRVFQESSEDLKAVEKKVESIDEFADIMDVTIMFVIRYTFFYKKIVYNKMSFNSENLLKMLRKSPASNARAAIFKNTDFS